MTKSISHKGVITSITAKVDGSVGYRMNTPELTDEEKTALFNLQNKNVEVLLQPLDETPTETITVDKDIEIKTPSQRLRNVLYLLWKQDITTETFESRYRNSMEEIIDNLKQKLDGGEF